jgi:hypothetical protein
MLIIKNKTEKIAKGYRLRKSTHNLIDKLQMIMRADQDTVITRACRMMYRDLRKRINQNNK